MANHQNHQNLGLDGLHKTKVVVVMVPFPAQGHLNQLLHLSRLIMSYNIPIHYACTATHIHQAILRVHGWDPNSFSNLHFHELTIPPFLCPQPNPNSKNKFPSHLQPLFNSSLHLREPIAALLRELSSEARRIIVINDSMMASVVQDVWESMGKNLERNANVIPKDFPSLEDCFTTEFLDTIASQYEFQNLNSGCLYNTCRILEATYMDLMEKLDGDKKHWAIGPFNPVRNIVENKTNSNGRHKCLEWLDKEAPKSVIYVSFGTTTAMEDKQIEELAIGLEQRFEERVKDKGLLMRDWAPQLEILSHPSTGAFMSHCGWNSCMESITMGVPIAAWPMASDQPRNTMLITSLLKVGIVVKDWSRRDQLVTSSTVENVVKTLMASKEGDEIRKRAVDMGEAVRRAMDKGGVSRLELDSFITHITR
uniref:Glycosyltransferase n=1 Tax=Fagus sylvatica TaxID=28930 RepID=A0A2N9IV47_FAGSY